LLPFIGSLYDELNRLRDSKEGLSDITKISTIALLLPALQLLSFRVKIGDFSISYGIANNSIDSASN